MLQQLQQLTDTLYSPHYIRCVKPNSMLKPAIFESFSVMQQLRCSGVLERLSESLLLVIPLVGHFLNFLNRFGILAPEVLELNCDEKIACTRILEKIGLLGFSDKENKGFPKNWSDG